MPALQLQPNCGKRTIQTQSCLKVSSPMEFYTGGSKLSISLRLGEVPKTGRMTTLVNKEGKSKGFPDYPSQDEIRDSLPLRSLALDLPRDSLSNQLVVSSRRSTLGFRTKANASLMRCA